MVLFTPGPFTLTDLYKNKRIISSLSNDLVAIHWEESEAFDFSGTNVFNCALFLKSNTTHLSNMSMFMAIVMCWFLLGIYPS